MCYTEKNVYGYFEEKFDVKCHLKSKKQLQRIHTKKKETKTFY